MSKAVSLHIDPEHEYGFTITVDGRSSHFEDVPPEELEHRFPEVRTVPRALLDAVAALVWAANSGAITGPQFFAAGRALDLGVYEFDASPRTYTFTRGNKTLAVVAAHSHDAIDAANRHFGLPETFAHWCFDERAANATSSV